MAKGWKSESARHALAKKGIKTGAKKKTVSPIEGLVVKHPETTFTDFFGGLGELFVEKTEQKGEEVGIGLLGAGAKTEEMGRGALFQIGKIGEVTGKKAGKDVSVVGGRAEETGGDLVATISGIGASLVTPKKKKVE